MRLGGTPNSPLISVILFAVVIVASVVFYLFASDLLSGSVNPTSMIASQGKAAPIVLTSPRSLLGNFSAIDVRYSIHNSTYAISEDTTYVVIGQMISNGTRLTVVNQTNAYLGSNSNSTTHFTLLFNSTWGLVLVSANGHNYTGAIASAFDVAFSGFFGLTGAYGTIWTEYLSVIQPISTGRQTFGNLTLEVAKYSESSVFYGGSQYQNLNITIGKLQNTNLSLLTNLEAQVTVNYKTAYTFTYQLISATRTTS